jgi:transitional endoplasmic reticulum ATPase
MPLNDNVNIKKLSEITHGFVGADIQSLCRESAMTCLRTIFPEIDFNLDDISYEKISKLEVTMDHFMSALNEIEPSAIREVFVEVPNVRWADVGGLDEVKEALRETVEWPLKYEKLFLTAKMTPAKGILLYGSPGTGKTLLAKALANESGVNFISVKGPSLLSKWVGESEKGVREVFKKAKQASPCIIFFDEIDALVPTRGGHSDSGVTERVISQFLTELDGIEELKGVFVLAATNRRELIDPALLRAGRFDLLFELPLPNEKARAAIFHVHTVGKPLASEFSFEELAGRTEGYTGADIEGICRKATLQSIRKFIEKHGSKAEKEAKSFVISKKDFEMALSEVKKQRPRPRPREET